MDTNSQFDQFYPIKSRKQNRLPKVKTYNLWQSKDAGKSSPPKTTIQLSKQPLQISGKGK